MKNVAVILLNYNSNNDLYISFPQIMVQRKVNIITIIVDNNSSENGVKELLDWYKNSVDNSLILKKDELFKSIEKKVDFSNKNFLILNDENRGYSAGNNIGIKLADYLNVDAVLIANPDMRFEDDRYINHLYNVLFLNKKYYIASSRILGLDNKEQNPLRESTFFEDFCWFCNIFKKREYVLNFDKNRLSEVPKVCGCCFMVKIEFLRKINFFDENVFLYSEEPILSSQVKICGGEIIFTPFKKVIHAHKSSEKGSSSKRMKIFIKSRIYYILNYSEHSFFKKILLLQSYRLLYLIYTFKFFLKR